MEPRDHFADITTPRGSRVYLSNLTEAQAAAVAAQFAPEEVQAPAGWMGKTKTCGQCQGAGGWEETVETKTGSGGTVVTKKRVSCRPCGGTGQVPDK